MIQQAKHLQAQRTYKPEGVSVAHINVADRTQPELWQWWIWAPGRDRYPDGLSLADKLPLQRALRDRTAILSASKRRGCIVLTAIIRAEKGECRHDTQESIAKAEGRVP